MNLSWRSITFLPHGPQIPWVAGSVPSWRTLLHHAQTFLTVVFFLSFLAMAVSLFVHCLITPLPIFKWLESPNLSDGRRDGKYPDVVTVGIGREEKETGSIAVIAQG